jgi:xanthine dehydrogenase accessory factor
VTLTERLLEIAERDERAVLFTVVEGPRVGDRLLVLENGDRLGGGPDELTDLVDDLVRDGRSRLVDVGENRVFAEVFGPPPRLLVFGAVDTAEALCRAAKFLGWRTIVADARAKFATNERIPSADELVVAWPEEALERVRPDHATAVVVLTHEDRWDVPALKGALATDAFYVGALGARRNQERRRERLLAEGVAETDIARIAGPSGLDIGADSPAETALSIMAEILATRAGRAGGPLRESKGRIHVEP